MKRKALILILLCSLGFLAWEAQAVNLKTSPKDIIGEGVPHGYEEIELRGTLATSVGPNIIEAGASDDDVYIGFNEDCGNVNISIYNDMGILVYSINVDSGMRPVVIIPFSGVASGTYTVELNNANGYAEGDFERD